jgi:hypothetical protein
MIPPGYLDLVRRRESGGNDNARNNLSSASGRYQFTDNTFVNTMMPLMPGKSRQDILALKNDPNAQDQAMQAFTMGNLNALKNAGIEPTSQNLYLAHHFGAGGATKLLKADPNTPLNQIFGSEVFAANPYMNRIADAQGLVSKWSGSGDATGGTNNMMSNTYTPEPMQEDNRFFKPENFGNSLINAGAAIASINSPAAGAAIAKLAKTDDSDFQTSVNQQTGQVVRVNKRTGAVQVMDAPALRQAQQAQAAQDMQDQMRLYEYKKQTDQKYASGPKVTDTTRKQHDSIFNEATMMTSLADDTSDILSAIRNKEVDYNLFNQYKNTAFSIMGLSDQQKAQLGLSPRAVEVFQKFERLKNTSALEEGMRQAGVETDKDFLNAIRARFGSNNFDGQNVEIALRDTLKDFGNKGKAAAERYASRARVFAGDAEINDPNRLNTVMTSMERAQKHLQTFEDIKKQDAEKPKGTSIMPQAPQQSAPTRINSEDEFKRLPTGSTFIGPDGKTYRKN